MSEAPEGLLDRIAEGVRQSIGANVSSIVLSADGVRQAEHSILLGALAGVVECWVAAAEPHITRERLKEALAAAIFDFVDQASDAQMGPIQ